MQIGALKYQENNLGVQTNVGWVSTWVYEEQSNAMISKACSPSYLDIPPPMYPQPYKAMPNINFGCCAKPHAYS
jgi:hypothetical protein